MVVLSFQNKNIVNKIETIKKSLKDKINGKCEDLKNGKGGIKPSIVVNKIETRDNNEGEVTYMVPSDPIYSLNPIKCRWLLVSYPGQQLSITFWNYKSLK